MSALASYLYQLWKAVDRLLNAIAGGWSEETVSARCWRLSEAGKAPARFLVRAINAAAFWQNNHCRGAYAKEKAHSDQPPEYRG